MGSQSIRHQVDLAKRRVDLLEVWGWVDESLRKQRAHLINVDGSRPLQVREQLDLLVNELKRAGWLTLSFEGESGRATAEHMLAGQLLEAEMNARLPEHIELAHHHKQVDQRVITDLKSSRKNEGSGLLDADEEEAWRSIEFTLPDEWASVPPRESSLWQEEEQDASPEVEFDPVNQEPAQRLAHALRRISVRRPTFLLISGAPHHSADHDLFQELIHSLRRERGSGTLLVITISCQFPVDDQISLTLAHSLLEEASPPRKASLEPPQDERVNLDSTGWLSDEIKTENGAAPSLDIEEVSTECDEGRGEKKSKSPSQEVDALVGLGMPLLSDSQPNDHEGFNRAFDEAFHSSFDAHPDPQELVKDSDDQSILSDDRLSREEPVIQPVMITDGGLLSPEDLVAEDSSEHESSVEIDREPDLLPLEAEPQVEIEPKAEAGLANTNQSYSEDTLKEAMHEDRSSPQSDSPQPKEQSTSSDAVDQLPVERGNSHDLFELAASLYGASAPLLLGAAAAGPTASIGQVSALWRGMVDRPFTERVISERLWEGMSIALGDIVLVETKNQRFASEPSFRFNDPHHHPIWLQRWMKMISSRLRRRAHRNLAGWMARQEVTDIARPQVALALIDHWVEGGDLFQGATASYELAQLLLERGDSHFAKRALQRTIQLLGPDGPPEYWFNVHRLLLKLALEGGDEIAAIMISRQLIERSWRLGDISSARKLSVNLERLYRDANRHGEAQELADWASSLPLDDHISALFDRPLNAFTLPPSSPQTSRSVIEYEHPTIHKELPPPDLDKELAVSEEENLLPLPELHTLESPPPSLLQVLVTLRNHGYEAYVVGGSVRDRLLGRPVNDWDLTTSALPHEVISCFERVIETGIEHGTVTVMIEDEHIEVTTYRVDGEYHDGRRPDQVEFTRSLSEDLLRRDFTVNAIAWDPLNAELSDPYNGVADLRRQILRAVGDPYARFQEDGLRVLRLIRFATVLDFHIDQDTLVGAREALNVLRTVSAERVQVELFKTLGSTNAHRGLELIQQMGVSEICLPELPELSGEGWARLMRAMERMNDDVTSRLSLIFHAFQSVFQWPKVALADQVKKTLKRLKVSNRVLNDCLHRVTFTALHHSTERDDVQVRALAAKMGKEARADIIAYRVAWIEASLDTETSDYEKSAWLSLEQRMIDLKVDDGPQSVRDLMLNGSDLCEALDLFPSRAIGELLDDLLRWVWSDLHLNQRELLLEQAKKIALDRGLI